MIQKDLSKRYATVLSAYPGTREELLGRLAQLEDFSHFLRSSQQFRKMLFSPLFTHDEKKELLHRVLKNQIEPLLIRFLCLLVDKRRITLLRDIAHEYRYKVFEKLGILHVVLLTAVPVEEQKRTELCKRLESAFQNTIHLREKVQPQMVGGVKLIVNNRIINNSIKDRLSKLKENLLAVTL